MSTKLTTVLIFCFAVLIALASAIPVKRDVWDPRIITPNAQTVWLTGQKYNVTWETDDAPVNITNSIGRVVLGKSGIQNKGKHSAWIEWSMPVLTATSAPAVLAGNFSIRLGSIEITVPDDLEPGFDYDIVLFGDSGNESPLFAIL
ncbi:uncharacterized protein B0H18DRAFT_1164086 [Fomitopsis serialis]|uniref:uncharacterized protein n=1 Tax=Fomitopsis serialis TaxID=139415 RepID=UPI002007D7B7|nr:uncharacterized protein B0H18DRAFT_1164086 [Neoantrodia serialis]KAH9936235.1 hypothetical protein B0H18DRAFT_1164086 [Neoantrodia serialis]